MNQTFDGSWDAFLKWLIEWRKTYNWNEDLRPIAGWIQKNGEPIVMFCRDGEPYPYSVQYAGSRHYFKTQSEALDYVRRIT